MNQRIDPKDKEVKNEEGTEGGAENTTTDTEGGEKTEGGEEKADEEEG